MYIKKNIRKNLRQLYNSIRNIYKIIIFLLFFPIALVFIFLLFSLEFVLRVRVYPLGALDHIGWQLMNPDRVFRSWYFRPEKAGCVNFILAHSPENKYHFQMLKRQVNLVDNKLVNWFVELMEPLLSQFRFFNYDHRLYHDPALYPPLGSKDYGKYRGLKFTPEEIERGYLELERMGVSRDDWFVCFHNRDNAFYNWGDHHFVRNSSIENFLLAAEYITSLGGVAIRMGAKVEKPLPQTLNPKIIDYATNFRTEFMDLFLGAHTKFFLGSVSGIYMIPMAFDRPILRTNVTDWVDRVPCSSNYFIPKLIIDKTTQEILTFEQSFSKGFESKNAEELQKFIESQYEFVENTPEDILAACKDMLSKIDGKPVEEEVEELQRYFDDHYVSEKHIDWVFGFEKIAPSFLLSKKHLIVKK